MLRWPLAAAILLLFAFLPSARAQTLTTLYSFTGSPHDGAFPVADLLLDAQGNLYGTTGAGGAGGAGTVFKLTPSGAETLLHSFSFPLTIVPSRRREGFYPWAGLVSDAAGNLYGTTYYG
ncbi:MAG: choice-of-anchor tandem repeat GloVer-containing protein, partial [Terriglobales bacterium]